MRLCRMFRRSVSLNCSKRSFYRRSPRLRLRSAEAWLPVRERITATWRKSIPKDKRPGWRLHLKSGWGLAEIRCGCTGQECPAGCGNHEAADIGFRGFKTRIGGNMVEAVAIYVGGRTGPH